MELERGGEGRGGRGVGGGLGEGEGGGGKGVRRWKTWRRRFSLVWGSSADLVSVAHHTSPAKLC